MKIKLLPVAYFIAVTGVCFAQNFENVEKPVIPPGRIIMADMKANNPVMYSQYQSGKKQQVTGIVLTSAGGGLFVMGAMFRIIPDGDSGEIKLGSYIIETDGDFSNLRKTGTVFMVAGAIGLSAGIPVWVNGLKKKKQVFQDFKNQYYLSQQPSSYFQMNIYANRVGIAYVF